MGKHSLVCVVNEQKEFVLISSQVHDCCVYLGRHSFNLFHCEHWPFAVESVNYKIFLKTCLLWVRLIRFLITFTIQCRLLGWQQKFEIPHLYLGELTLKSPIFSFDLCPYAQMAPSLLHLSSSISLIGFYVANLSADPLWISDCRWRMNHAGRAMRHRKWRHRVNGPEIRCRRVVQDV